MYVLTCHRVDGWEYIAAFHNVPLANTFMSNRYGLKLELKNGKYEAVMEDEIFGLFMLTELRLNPTGL